METKGRKSITVDSVLSPTLAHSSASSPLRVALCLEWLAGQPLVVPAIGLVLGILLDAYWRMPILVVLVLFVLAGGLLIRCRLNDGIGHVAILLAALAVGSALHDLSFRHFPENHIVRYCGQEPRRVRLTGTVISTPMTRPVDMGRITWFEQLPRTRMHVAAEKLQSVTGDIDVCGTISVMVREPALQTAAGDRVELLGTMFRQVPTENPGERDYALYSRRQGIFVQISCSRATEVRVQSSNATRHRWLSTLRRRVRSALLDNAFPGDEPGSQILSAMVLGQRSMVTSDVNEAFAATGTIHYLSVSGAHVGMLASVLWLAGMFVGASRRACAIWVMLAITAYAVLAEPRPPILRAMLMGDLLCVGILLRRPVRPMNWLAMSAIILLAVRPTQLFEPGFQLSFGTVIVILYLGPLIHRKAALLISRLLRRDDPLLDPQMQELLTPTEPTHSIVKSFWHMLGWWMAITFSAWLASLLLATYYFHRFALWGWLNNVLVLPLVWLTQVLGLTKTVLALVWQPLGDLLGQPLAWVTDALIGMVTLLSELPGSGASTPAIPAWLVVTGFAVLALWVLSDSLRIDGRWVATSALAFVVLTAWRLAPFPASDICRVHLLAVGKGAASVIQLPNGNTLVYDLGTMPPYNLQKWTVGPLFASERIYSVDAAIISHAHIDHYCGLPDLADSHTIGKVFSSPHFIRDTEKYSSAAKLLEDMRRYEIPWQTMVQGDRLTGTGNVQIDVLWPPPIDELAIKETNDTAIVLRISCAGWRILLCGDIGELPQRHLLASADLKADVLLLPHHGKVESSTAAFIRAVDPSYCIRTGGQRNTHTTNGLIDLMADCEYYNTADDGAIEIRMTPTTLHVEP